MIDLYITFGPWVLSTVTIILTILQGNKYKYAWGLTLVNQCLWLLWILSAKVYGFLPLNICMWVVCIRNHMKWSKEDMQ